MTFRNLFIVSLIFFTFQLQARSWEEGYVVTEAGDTLWGLVKYRRLEVPRKLLFKTTDKKKRAISIDGARSFVYGKEYWQRISLPIEQIGWADSFFFKRLGQSENLQLFYGKYSSEGCGCNGKEWTVRKSYILHAQGASFILSFNRQDQLSNYLQLSQWLKRNRLSQEMVPRNLGLKELEEFLNISRTGNS